MKTSPFPYQLDGIRFLQRVRGRGLIGDDMGLGKTIQVLGWMGIHPKARPAIIVCPARAKWEWVDQLRKHTRMHCEIIEGKTPYQTTQDIIIINYDLLTAWLPHLLTMKPKLLVMDECHYIKNMGAQRTKACIKLARVCRFIIPMSGTPIVNRPSEFFPVLNALDPVEFDSFWRFAMRYCAPKRGFHGRGWTFNGACNIEELHKRIKPYMIRRIKEDVLTQLPKKRRITISVDLENRQEYEEARDDFLQWYERTHGKTKAKRASRAEEFVRLGQLKQICARGKLIPAFQWIDDFLKSTGEKLVLFSHHRDVQEILYKTYHKKEIAITGKHDHGVKRFQEDKRCRLFIGSLKADGTAITLTAASNVMFLELGWTPGEHDQAEDRINRIGQKASSLTAWYLLARDSIDEDIWTLIEEKRKVTSMVLDGKLPKNITEKISIESLVKKMKGERHVK